MLATLFYPWVPQACLLQWNNLKGHIKVSGLIFKFHGSALASWEGFLIKLICHLESVYIFLGQRLSDISRNPSVVAVGTVGSMRWGQQVVQPLYVSNQTAIFFFYLFCSRVSPRILLEEKTPLLTTKSLKTATFRKCSLRKSLYVRLLAITVPHPN